MFTTFWELLITCLLLIFNFSQLIHDCFMTCLWLVHYFFMICSLPGHELFITWSWLVHDYSKTSSLFDNFSNFTCSWLFHILFTICYWLVSDLFITCPFLVHDFFLQFLHFSANLQIHLNNFTYTTFLDFELLPLHSFT